MKKILSIVLVLVLSFGCFSIVSFAEETEAVEHLTEVPDGYVGVYTVEDLYCVRNDLTANYILMNDIDLTEATAEGGDWDFYGNGWNPIGSNDVYSNSAFRGIFDGNGYTVKGMRIELNTIPSGAEFMMYLGLFSEVTGTVKNLTVEGSIYASVNGSRDFCVGSIAGSNCGTIDNCINKVEMVISEANSSNHDVLFIGGITGCNSDTISNCINIKDIYGYFDNNNTSSIVGIAGISGINGSIASIKNCINTGNITVDKMGSCEAYAAGIGSLYFGCEGGTISNCYNTGEIVASTSGTTYSSMNYPYAAGIGFNATCSYSYNVGTVSGYYNCAISNNSATKCYYLAGVGGDSTGATSLTPAQMKLKSMYSGWDFDTVWTMDGRSDYPYPELRDVDLVLPEDLVHQHEYTSEITTPATHLADGLMTYTCECGDSYTEVLERIVEHTYTSEVTTQPTHLTEGVETYTCECGDTYTEAIAKTTEHSYTSEVTTQPTHLTEGVETFTCECGDAYTEALERIVEHTYTSEVTTQPTHLTEGVEIYTCECGDTYTEAIKKTTDHSYDAVVTAPTCIAQGYTTYTCECGYSYNDDFVNALGHNFEPTVTAPTCTTKGYTTYTCACGETYVADTVDATGHNFVAIVTAPTCVKYGYTTFVCICGENYVGDYVSVKGHIDNNNDYKCDYNCGFEFEKIDTPTPSDPTPPDPTKDCSCDCHNSGLAGLLFKLINFFQKLFGMNKVCACGVKH